MAVEKFDRTKTTKDAKALLKEGKTKQEAFDILVRKYRHPKQTADILQYIPDEQAVKKYGIYNHVLTALFLLTVAYFVWHGEYFLLSFGIVIYATVRMLIRYYVWISAFSAAGLISFVALFFFYDAEPAAVVLALLCVPQVILPLWLEKKLSNKPVVKKEKYTDSQGYKKFRLKYTFNENNE